MTQKKNFAFTSEILKRSARCLSYLNDIFYNLEDYLNYKEIKTIHNNPEAFNKVTISCKEIDRRILTEVKKIVMTLKETVKNEIKNEETQEELYKIIDKIMTANLLDIHIDIKESGQIGVAHESSQLFY